MAKMERGLLAGLLLVSFGREALAADIFTTNAICKRNNCINPIFPGMEDLSRLESAAWTCSSLRETAEHMSFCRSAVTYDPSLPNPTAADGGDDSVKSMVRRQDQAASTMFVYHLAGLGLEAWDYTKPENSDDDCVRSIWRMVCYTYFPRAKLGCQVGLPTQYTRPCQSSCHNYIRQCGVECCDESVQCVFEHKKAISRTQSLVTTGYVPHDGPSSVCTGGARRSQAPGGILALAMLMQAVHWFGGSGGGGSSAARSSRGASGGAGGASWHRRLVRLAAPVSLVAMSATLQGCNTDVPTHTVGNWRAEKDYLLDFEFVPPGAPAEYATLNSCSIEKLAPTLQCNGRGVCKLWDETNLHDKSMSFCECSRDWADPECRTRRKSQVLAYLLSVFAGPFGADQFYLGFWYSGVFKACSLGGFGIWWIYDIIRIGSAPVQTATFRLAGDLPHWVFVLLTVNFALLIGFIISWITATSHMMKRRKDVLLLQAEEEARALGLNKQPRSDLRRAGADMGDRIPQVTVGQSAASPFYGSMNTMGQVPVSPASSMGMGYGSRGPAKPGPMAYSIPQSMGGAAGYNPTPPSTIPGPPGTMGPYGGATMYGSPATSSFAGGHAEEAL